MSTDDMQPPDVEVWDVMTTADLNFEVTDERHYQCGDDRITVQIQDNMDSFRWRMKVNEGEMSSSYGLYIGMLGHDGYCVGTAYWGGTFPEFIPFKIILAEEIIK